MKEGQFEDAVVVVVVDEEELVDEVDDLEGIDGRELHWR